MPEAKQQAEKPSAPAVRTPVDEIAAMLRKMLPEFTSACGTEKKADLFIRVLITTLRGSELSGGRIHTASKQSIYSEALKAAQDGLLLDGREAILNVYAGVAKYQPMVYGLCKRARNSGEIKDLNARIVYDGDLYRHWTDRTGENFTHETTEKTNTDKPLRTYAYVITKDGTLFFEEMTETELAQIEKCSKASDSPWKGPFKGEMKRKSVLRRLLKYRVPSSADIDTIAMRDDDLFELKKAAEPEPAPVEGPSRLKGIVAAHGGKKETEKKAEPKKPEPEPEPAAAEGEETPI